MKYRPMLAPNNKADGSEIDWFGRLELPNKTIWEPKVSDWAVSEKFDGIRAVIKFENGDCTILTRSLKKFRSKLIQKWENQLSGLKIPIDIIIDAEIYCENMTFNELQHFILSENVTSKPSVTKTIKAQKIGLFGNRSLNWLSTYYHDFKLHFFDSCMVEGKVWELRYNNMAFVYHLIREQVDFVEMFDQHQFETVEEIIRFYDTVIEDGGEGLILKHRLNQYKFGRVTLHQGTLFKMKDEMNWYVGKILDVLEGTEVGFWADTTINELGYSRTSKLQDDRLPSGKAKGFLVETWPEKRQLTVTLKGFTNDQKEDLLLDKEEWIGNQIEFMGMKPTKLDGVPRMAKYINKNK